MDKRNLEDALNSMLRTDYIPLSDTVKLSLLADYYIDYFGYLGQLLGETDQLLVGRRGTGKTTLLYRALVDCMRSWGTPGTFRAKPRTLGIYIDLEKCQSLNQGTVSGYDQFEHAFVSEFCEALTAELTRSWPAFSEKPKLFSRLFKSAEARKASEVKKQLTQLADVLMSGVPRFVELAPVKGKHSSKTTSTNKSGIGANLSSAGPSLSMSLDHDDELEIQDEIETVKKITYRLTVADILKIIGQLREAADIPCVLLFVDEFSALSSDLQAKFSTLLKKLLGNHSGLFIKVGAITDNYQLGSSIILQRDLFELSLDLDAFVERTGSLGTAMTDLEDLTERIIRERLRTYEVGAPSILFDDLSETWREITRSAMGVPRTIGIVLKQAWHRADSSGHAKIRRRDIDYGIRYASKAYLNQMIGAAKDGVAIPEYVIEMWDTLLTRAIRERGKAKTVPASHFMVLPRNEIRLKYLNMFFLIHLLTQGRTTKKETLSRSLYSFDYGICLENNLIWGDEKNVIRQQRFAYDSSLTRFDRFFQSRDETEYICPVCRTVYAQTDLRVGNAQLSFCLKDKSDLEIIVYPQTGRAYTEEEIKIIGAIRSAQRGDRLAAQQVADDVGCYVQKVSRFADKLNREKLIALAKDSELDRRIYFGPD